MENKVYYGQYSLRHWISLILKKNIILPEYQRHFVWNEKKVETLIETFRKKQFVPPVTIGAFKIQENNTNLILDGQQRLTSILLSYLGLYPDVSTYKKAIEKFAGGTEDEEDVSESIDNVFEWTFERLTEKGSDKKEILRTLSVGNYKISDFRVDDQFFDENFLGFSYLVPVTSDEKNQQKYYSSVFRNINVQGETLLPQESRASLYFLDKDLKDLFSPEFSRKVVVKTVSGESILDFVRCLSLVSQFKKDNSADYVARGHKQKMEKYYEEYIYSVIDDTDDKYGKFSDIFPGRKYRPRLEILQEILASMGVKKFTSVIDLDMYLFGMTYVVLLEGKALGRSKISELKKSLEQRISELRSDESHAKSPGHLKYLRLRISESIAVYQKYAS